MKIWFQGTGNAGFALSVFNLMNAILGSGILGLSYAMAQLGIVLFTLICGGVAALALYAIILLLRMCKITGANVSFEVPRPWIPGRTVAFGIFYGGWNGNQLSNVTMIY